MVRIALFGTLAVLAGTANGFVAPVSRPTSTISSTARNVLLSQEETDAIITRASDCAEGECSVDDISGLVGELKDQQDILNARLVDVMNMVAHLQKVNQSKDRKKDEVRAFVQDLLRVFNHEDPKVFPTGFTGDIGDGPTTAYDALPPKKWTPSE
mmetsp:Transcript_32877/g.97965  ORF Transcript_32877/g.97965 Transcript_32877/m.97965 type:complete len:155 (-) Transcript_32877:239-703(-)|eukprot:CAMPEP_0113525896 /NCGR_PEP_ID=MMETSP0015_2-20120614/435_1 /TAXON_ID=2838 /ORGANISM="Odontella" /LENGTH=154 /DNA_ID=CAMNT_0000424151 /DNA_START=71 /DNA_END=535 /DNA_ORIENTATION=+ /assembly_acc=CAM_ASM_000160